MTTHQHGVHHHHHQHSPHPMHYHASTAIRWLVIIMICIAVYLASRRGDEKQSNVAVVTTPPVVAAAPTSWRDSQPMVPAAISPVVTETPRPVARECHTLPAFRCETRGCGADDNPCFEGCACPAPMCIIDSGTRKCIQSHMWRSDVDDDATDETTKAAPSTSHTKRFTTDGRCVRDAPPDGSVTPVDATVTQLRLKAHWLFPKDRMTYPLNNASFWAKDAPNVASRVKVSDSGVVTFSRMCLRPSGSPLLLGDNATLNELPYLGLETGSVLADGMKEFQQWLKSADTIAAPPSGVRWVASSVPVVLVPVVVKADNAMHVLHRVGTIMSYMADVYGSDFADRAVMVYVVTHRGRRELQKGNAHSLLRRMLSKEWLSVHTARDEDDTAEKLPPPIVCFSQLLFISMSERKSINEVPTFVPNHFLFTLSGQRSARDRGTVQLFRQTFAHCAAPDVKKAQRLIRSAPRLTHPKLTIVWRSFSRRFVGFATLAPEIEQFAHEIGFESVTIVEPLGLNLESIASIFADSDVIIGMYGAGLSWAVLMPPGAVIIEITRDIGCANGRIGWFKSPQCDYGGDAEAAGQFHFSHMVPAFSAIRGSNAYGVDGRIYIPLLVWKRLLTAALCRLQVGRPITGENKLSPYCDVSVDYSPDWPRQSLGDT